MRLLITLFFLPIFSFAQQNVAINNNGSAPDASAILDVQSTTQGMLVPRMDSMQRNMILNPAAGLLVFDTSLGSFHFYNGSEWVDLSSSQVIADHDNDTKIEAEKTMDEDTLRFTVDGFEIARLSDNRMDFEGPGHSIFIGKSSGIADDKANNYVTAVGFEAGKAQINGFGNAYFGANAGTFNEAGDDNTFIGTSAGYKNESFGNTMIGRRTGFENINGDNNAFLGAYAGYHNTGNKNVFLGAYSGENSTSNNNIYIGYNSGKDNSGLRNIIIGKSAGENSTGGDNVLIGYESGISSTSNGNVMMGSFTGYTNTSGQQNTFLGDQSGYFNSIGNINTFVGKDAGFTNSSGSENTFIGFGAGRQNEIGVRNTSLGSSAGYLNNGSRNTNIGAKSGLNNTSGSGNVFLGYEAGKNELGSDKLYIANDSTDTPLVFGDFNSNKLLINRKNTIGSEVFGVRANVTGANYGGMYMETNGSQNSRPFYGFAINGVARSWIYHDGLLNELNFWHTGLVMRLRSDELILDGQIKATKAIELGDDQNTSPVAGTIRWNTSSNDFEGYDGTEWKSLTTSAPPTQPGSPSFGISTISEIATGVDTSSSDFYNELGKSIEIDGNYAIVAAAGHNTNGNDNQGKAYIYFYNNTQWELQDTLISSDGAAYDNFGSGVSISGDFAVVGALGHDTNGNSQQGKAYVFKRSGSNWNQDTILTGSGGGTNDLFGTSVDIDGEYIIIGAAQYHHSSSPGPGKAYVFKRIGNIWSEETILNPVGAANNDQFGQKVSISGDYAIIGSQQDVGGNSEQGNCYVFKMSGGSWSLDTTLVASDGAAEDFYGFDVDIDGDQIVVGAREANHNGESNRGKAYVYSLNGGSWVEDAILLASDGSAFKEFGYAVSIRNNNIIVSSWEQSSGSVYYFSKNGSSWKEQSKLEASDSENFTAFGQDLVVGSNHILIGAPRKDINGVDDQGKVYFY